MSKIWAWFKRNWKWIVFPVGIVGVVFCWFFWWRKPKDDSTSTTTDSAADQAIKDTVQSQDDRDKSLKELEQRHAEKLAAMSEEQKAKFDEIKQRPIEEVALWIDSL